MNFDHIIDYNDNGWEDGGFGEEMEETHERAPTNLEENTEARLPNAPMSLESAYVG